MKKLILSLAVLVGLSSCTSDSQLSERLKKIVKDDPSIVINAIESNPAQFIEALQKAARVAQERGATKRKEEEKRKLEASYSNPLVPEIRSNELIRGNKSAPITLVEYSDFECPFCARALTTVKELQDKYGNNIKFVYKHLPLSFHPNAMKAAQYFEAVALQSEKRAWEFHDKILLEQRKLKQGEKYLKAAAKSLGVNMKKLSKDITGDVVKKKIESDIKEAQKFGFQGTPGFIINGVPVKGAYPTSHFEGIIEELKKRGKLKI